MRVFPDNVVKMILPKVSKAINKLGATHGVDLEVLYAVNTNANDSYLGIASEDVACGNQALRNKS